MKKAKKISVLFLSLLFLFSSFLMTANADNNSVFVDNFNPLLRYWHYGGYPDKVTYTSGGYVALESTHYEQQHQVCFYGQPLTNQWDNLIKQSVSDDRDGLAAFDVYVRECHGTNKFEATNGTGHIENAPGLNVIIKGKFKDGSKTFEEEIINFEAPVGGVKIGETKHFLFSIGDYADYDSFEITFVKVAVINYANPANELGEQGCGEFYVRFSPFYLEGSPAPEVGTDLGENFDPSNYSWESTDKVTTISQGNLTPDGPLYGGVDLKRNDAYLPYLSDGITVAKLNPDNETETTTTQPVCKHTIKTTKVTKKATYFAYGVKTTYCALCNKALSTSKIKKLILAKSSIKTTSASKAVNVSWKKISGATGYVVEMKSGSKFKVVKTITSTKTLSYKKTKLKKGTKYSFRVKAMVKSGSKKAYGAYSAVKTAKAK